MQHKPKIIYVISEDWAFCSHRLPLAKFALAAGFEVILITHVSKHRAAIEHAGVKLIPLATNRGGINPLADLKIIWQLIKIYKHEKPDLVHHVALKPVIYGSLAAKFSGVNKVVNALGGVGFVFSAQSLKARWLRPLVKLALKISQRINVNTRLIVQNQDDYALLQACCHLETKKMVLIRGAGVDLNAFFVAPEPTGTPVVVLAARMLWDKGVGEFVAAAQLLKQKNINVRMALVGDIDRANPKSISAQQLQQWHQKGDIEWWGHQEDMQAVFSQAHIVCLPSYREGLPKVLLEAAACGRAIITTDVPGCRDVIESGISGTLIPMQDSNALANAIVELAANKDLREQYGQRARERVVAYFSESQIIQETMQIYRDLLKD